MKSFLSVVFLLIASSIFCQKKIIDKEAIDNWLSLQSINDKCGLISGNGKFAAYKYASAVDGSTIVLKDLSSNIELKYKGASEPAFSSDSKYFFIVLADNSLLIRDLTKRTEQVKLNVQSYKQTLNKGAIIIAYLSNKEESGLIVENLSNEQIKQFDKVKQFQFSANGSLIVINSIKGLEILELSSYTGKLISESNNVEAFCISYQGDKIAFATKDNEKVTLQCFNVQNHVSMALVSDSINKTRDGFYVVPHDIAFSGNGNIVYFKLGYPQKQISDKYIISKDVNVWAYKDLYLQEVQATNATREEHYTAAFNMESNRLIQIESVDYRLCMFGGRNNQYHLVESKVNEGENYWNNEISTLYLISLTDGRKIKLAESTYPAFSNVSISPDENYVIWFDGKIHKFIVYDIQNGRTHNLTRNIEEELSIYNQRGIAAKSVHTHSPHFSPVWLNDHSILIGSQYDLWQVDPNENKAPINLTNEYGKKHKIRFRVLRCDNNIVHRSKGKILTWALNENSKENGFWEIQVGQCKNPSKSVMENRAFFFDPLSSANIGIAGHPSSVRGITGVFNVTKAEHVDVYLCQRMSATESPNVFITKDFKTFNAVSNIAPEAEYQWLKSQLLSWQLPDGSTTQGILHVPENFDSTKKYPVIFTFYERHSEYLNVFRYPVLPMGPINIPWYTNRGYLVFEPDFYYATGKTAKNVLETVETAAIKLAEFKYIDTSCMGAMGHSHGGYEANVIAAGTNIFKAVCAMAGYSNIISEYGSIRPGGYNNQRAADLDQRNLGVFPWDRPDVFIENSPVFHIAKMTTPLLLVHNKGDNAVSFSQAMEMYLNMRRARKKVWMLEYTGEGHAISKKEANKLDFNIRMQQFFDHYLKGAPAPLWMVEGVPAKDKGIKSGLELDTLNRVP